MRSLLEDYGKRDCVSTILCSPVAARIRSFYSGAVWGERGAYVV